MPVLMKITHMTSGPILELGSGMYSTCYLHWACYPMKRKLVTYESKAEWFDFAKQFSTDFHSVHFVENWDVPDLSEPWSMAFVDHAPDERRLEEIKRLLHAEYIVVHDTENRSDRKYKFSSILKLFKYRYKYSDAYPHTSVFSNKHDLANFTVIG